MKRIYLKSNGVGRYDEVTPFVVTDNKLELKIDLPNVSGEFYFIGENNGQKIKRLIPRGGSITLEGLTAGELNAEIKHEFKGVLLKTYKTEPLILKEIDGSLSAMPEIEALNAKCASLERALEETKEAANKSIAELEKRFTKAIAEERGLTVGLLKFARADYKDNVYLGGGSFGEFIKRYGFTGLTEEELKIIKGDDGDDND